MLGCWPGQACALMTQCHRASCTDPTQPGIHEGLSGKKAQVPEPRRVGWEELGGLGGDWERTWAGIRMPRNACWLPVSQRVTLPVLRSVTGAGRRFIRTQMWGQNTSHCSWDIPWCAVSSIYARAVSPQDSPEE